MNFYNISKLDFDIDFYKLINNDLKNISNKHLLYHYLYFGKNEDRIACENDFYKLYPSFNINYYKLINNDLTNISNKYLLYHYHKYGKNNISNKYLLHNYKNEENIEKKNFRKICELQIKYIKNIYLPNFLEYSDYESVLIEYRCFPHLEFLIRNTILKLGDKWCHSIICGNLNYEFMIKMCSTISNKIKIIKTNYDNLFPTDYSLFLSSLDFWNLLNGKKILIYQEDSIIFNSNIEDFLHWDYIGAPWPEYHNINKLGVGNGGISLRTKDIMIKIINNIKIFDTQYNINTLEYIKNSRVPPEDVYFSINMEKLNIGLLADRISASNFSTELILNNNSFAGHNFWLCDSQWKNRIYNIIQQLKSKKN